MYLSGILCWQNEKIQLYVDVTSGSLTLISGKAFRI